jgi:DNA replication protein DnaC
MLTKCDRCDNRGYVIGWDAAGYETVTSFCTCAIGQNLKDQIREEKMKQSNILRHYFSYNLGGITVTQNQKFNYFLRIVNDFATHIDAHKKSGTHMLVCGPTNTGKTLLASLLLKEALRKGYTAYYLLWPELLKTNIEDTTTKEFVRNTDFLVLDDFAMDDVRADSAYPQVTFDTLLKIRYGNLLPTIILTRKPTQEVFMKYETLRTYIPPTNLISLW